MKIKTIIFIVCALLIGIIAFILINNLIKPSTPQELSYWASSKLEKIVNHRREEFSARANISRIISESWKEIDKNLRDSGASEQEVQTILKAAHKYVDGRRQKEQAFQAAPVLIRDAYIDERHLWVIGFAWGYAAGNMPIEGLGNVSNIVIDAKTGQILAGMSCG